MKPGFPLLTAALILLSSHTKTSAQVSDTTVLSNWALDPYSFSKIYLPVDTALTRFHIINPLYQEPSLWASLGNIGSPAFNIDFFRRKTIPDFAFASGIEPYLLRGANTRFFNTRKPFTHLVYSNAGTKVNQEQTLRALHTQNINPDFNVGLQYDLTTSEGQYTWQKTRLPLFRLFSSYEKTRYSMHASLNFNKAEVQENGGITDDNDLEGSRPKDIPVNLVNNLNNALSVYRNNEHTLLQTYTVGGSAPSPDSNSADSVARQPLASGTFSHLLEYSSFGRTYSDQQPLSGFYDTVLISSLRTGDSAVYRNLGNTLMFEFRTDTTRRFSLLARGGIGHEFSRFVNRMPTDTQVVIPPGATGPEDYDTVFNKLRSNQYHNIRIDYFLRNALTHSLVWDAGGHLYLSGYKQGDLLVSGNLRLALGKKDKPLFFHVNAVLENRKPSYFLNAYQSNHFEWSEDFGNITDTRLSGRIVNADGSLSLRGNYALIANHVYIDEMGYPAQENPPLSVISTDAFKLFRLGHFRSLHRLSMQLTSNDLALPLPLAGYYQSTWFDHRIFFRLTNGVLYYQLGFDLIYHTSYYGPAYMPATGLFYNQREKETGNYPYLDVFVNLKVQRTRFFLKYEHVYSGLLPANFFTVPHYPMNQRMFKFGLAWTFYN